MKKILFLCTGNYYRSRFAEHLFNELAQIHQLPWYADSRALALQLGVNNIGNISPYTLTRLQQLGIALSREREPQQVVEVDLQNSHKIIALDEEEHRPFVTHLFPEWTDKIDYWMVHDLHLTDPRDALAEIERKINLFVETLK
jgi:protein-tyrosine phosphatase